MSMTRRLELLDWAKDADAFVFEDDYDSEFRYDGAPLLSLAGIDHLRRVDLHRHVCEDVVSGIAHRLLRAAREHSIGPVTSARAALDRFPGTLLEGAVADMLNSGAFAANLRKVRGLYREARDVLASTLSKASDGKLSVPVPSQGLHLVARFDPSTDPLVASQAKAAAGVEGWLLAETYIRARPLPGFVLGFSGHPIPQLIASAEKLAKASLTACAQPQAAMHRRQRRRPHPCRRDRPVDHRCPMRIAMASLSSWGAQATLHRRNPTACRSMSAPTG